MRERITTTHNHQWLLVAANHLSPVSFLAVLKQAPKLNQGEPSIFNRVICVCVPCVGCVCERAQGRDAHSRSALLRQTASCARCWCSSAMVLGEQLYHDLRPIHLRERKTGQRHRVRERLAALSAMTRKSTTAFVDCVLYCT